MKLKQRVWCAVILASCVIFAVLCVAFTQILQVLLPHDRAPYLKPSLEEFRALSGNKMADDDVREPELLVALHNHLAAARHELNVNGSDSKSQPDARDVILRDPIVQRNAEAIIDIAHELETQRKVAHAPASPDAEDIVAREAENLASKVAPAFRAFQSISEQDRVLLDFKLPEEIVQKLDKLVPPHPPHSHSPCCTGVVTPSHSLTPYNLKH